MTKKEMEEKFKKMCELFQPRERTEQEEKEIEEVRERWMQIREYYKTHPFPKLIEIRRKRR